MTALHYSLATMTCHVLLQPFWVIQLHCLPFLASNRDKSAGGPSDWKARRNTDGGSIARCGKDLFSQSWLLVQTLLRCPYIPRVQAACIDICTNVKNPRPCQPYCCSDTRKYCKGMGSVRSSCGGCSLIQLRREQFPHKEYDLCTGEQ